MKRPAPEIDPPPMIASPELRWLMLRAFGPAGAFWAPQILDDDHSANVAVRLDIAARIGSRFAAEEIGREAGPVTAAVVVEARDEAAVQIACLQRLLDEVSSAAAELGMPVLVLKGMAYQLNRSLAPGSRPTGDLDLLAPAARAQELFTLLVDRGYRQVANRGTDYHLPVLQHPHGMVLEIHTHIAYLETEYGEPLDLDFLIKRGWARAFAGLPDGCLIPQEDLLMAHLLGHFLGQHRQSPIAYPLCRMLLDCADLDWEPPRWDSFLDRGYGFIANLVRRSDIDAVRQLLDRLTAGDDAGAIVDADDGGARMLRHGVLGALDPLYRDRLIGHAVVQSADSGDRPARLLVFAAKRLWRPQHELEQRFGGGSGKVAHFRRRLQGIVSPMGTAFRLGLPWLWSAIRDRIGRTKRI